MELIDPSIALLVSVTLVILLVFRKVNVGVSLGVGAMLYGFLSLGLDTSHIVLEAFNIQMIQTLVALTLSMLLADIYNSVGASSKLIESFEVVGPRFAAFSTPAVIGLLPMPGGAYVSAVVVDPLYESMGLGRELKTFINYWFRHLWLTTWPLYQGVILASGLLGLSTSYIMVLNMPITLAALISGLIIGLKEIKKNENVLGRASNRDLKKLIHIWPFPLIAILTVALNLNIVFSIALTTILFILFYRPGGSKLLHALKYSVNPTFIGVIIFSFIFSEFIEKSNVAYHLTEILSGYAEIAVFLIPLVIVMGTGIEFTYIALAFPPLIQLFNSERLLLSFTGGFIGAMLTPAHACLVMSSDYYKSELPKTYRYIIPSTIFTTALIFLYVFLI
ncbi:MAG: DUF401 family protein [Candidatus Caldarchaeales archaeon]